MPRVPRITLKQGKEKPLLRGHPWVFSGAVAKIEEDISPQSGMARAINVHGMTYADFVGGMVQKALERRVGTHLS